MAKRKRKSGGFGERAHSRKKIERLMYPVMPSAPWLGPPTGRLTRGRGHKFGKMHFTIYRKEEHPIGPGRLSLAKNPYQAKVCIGAPHRQKRRVAGRFDSKFSRQKGSVMGCEWGSGKSPTRALSAALVSLGRHLSKAKRGGK